MADEIVITAEAVEAVARMLCTFEGTHPDRLQKTITGEEGLPMWTRYELLARGAIFAAAPFFRQQHPASPSPGLREAVNVETLIFNAYMRGADWLRENGAESWPYVTKAASDYADKTTSASRPVSEREDKT